MAQQQVLQFQPLRAKQVGLHAVHTDSSDTKKASQ